MRNAGRVLTHKQILNVVWGPAHAEDVQYLRVLVGQLRQKIEKSPAEPTLVLPSRELAIASMTSEANDTGDGCGLPRGISNDVKGAS